MKHIIAFLLSPVRFGYKKQEQEPVIIQNTTIH